MRAEHRRRSAALPPSRRRRLPRCPRTRRRRPAAPVAEQLERRAAGSRRESGFPRSTSSAATTTVTWRASPAPREDRLDLAPERAGDDCDRHARGRIARPPRAPRPRPSRRRADEREVAVDPLLDETRQLVALDAEPRADDRLLRVSGERAVVLLLGERTALLGEELAVHRAEDRLVLRERPVEVEGDGPRRHRTVSLQPSFPRPSCSADAPRDRPGDDRDDLPRRRRGAPDRRPRLPGDPSALPAAGLGRARSRGDLGERRSPPRRTLSARRASPPRSSTRSASRTSARRPSSGSARTGRPVAARDRLAGPADGRALPRAPADLDPRADRPPARPVLLGDEARMAPRARRPAAARARVRHRRQLARVAPHGRRRARHRRDERVADDCSRSRRGRLGRRAARALRRRARAAARGSCRRAASSARPTLLGASVPIAGIAGDQQAALFGQGCFAAGRREGDVRHRQLRAREHGQRRAVPPPRRPPPNGGRRRAGAPPQFALEGSVLVAGAAVQWLRDGLGSSRTRARPRRSRAQVDSTGGVSFVPALTGPRRAALGPDARGLITGTDARDDAGASRPRRARGDRLPGRRRARRVLPAQSTCSAPTAAPRRTHSSCSSRPTSSAAPSRSPPTSRATGLGAAALAGLACGTWTDVGAMLAHVRRGARYEPRMPRGEADRRRAHWHDALRLLLDA